MLKTFIFVGLLFFPALGSAVENAVLSVKQIKTQGWQLHGINISLTRITTTPKLQLTIQKLQLPKPFADLKLLAVQCNQFNWGNNEIHCQQGSAELQSKKFHSPRLKFSFHITPKQSQFQIRQLKLLDGNFDLHASSRAKHWQLSLNGKQVGLKILHELLFPELKISSGKFSIQAQASGNHHGLQQVKIQTRFNNLSLQTADGSKACEKMQLNTDWQARKTQSNLWSWRVNNLFQQGSLYLEPLYLEHQGKAMSLEGQGYWQPQKQQLEISSAQLTHPEVGLITAHGMIKGWSAMKLENMNFYLSIPELAQASAIYFEPFTTATALEGVSLAGKLEARLKFKQQNLNEAYLYAKNLAITDKKQRIDLSGGVASLDWADNSEFNRTSLIFWQKFNLFGIPLESSYFSLLLKQQKISLLQATRIPLLQGQMRINAFEWQKFENKPPRVHFSGNVENLSLTQLSEALAWQRPLVGNISGDIPSVNFSEGKLTLDGGLKINVFDGEIAIHKLALSGLFSDFSQVYSDIDITNLDLEKITQRFSFGGMQGRISGYVRNLYLENWQPMTFYAWLGTPEGDDSTHQISQKAVENIASIGGGGVIDLFSRAILSIFDNFSYDELGLGCYLHNGVCQLMGVAPADYGYYIVKGGGLPRIDVMGYNPRIDWEVLQERLQRIVKSSSEAVVE